MDKKLTAIEFRCSDDFKEIVDGIAASLNVDRSEFVRRAVEVEVDRHITIYESLHKVFGNRSK